MTIRLLNRCSSLPSFFFKRLTNTQSSINLANEMKSLNDKKQFKKTLAILDQHGTTNITTLSNFAIIQALKACAHMRDLQRGKTIQNLIAFRTKNDMYVSSALIHMYVECADITSARSLLDSAINKTPSMYGIIMKGYIKNKQANKAIDLFNAIQNPNDIHIIILLNACAQLKTKEALDIVKKLSNRIPKSFFSNPRILTSLLDALMKCGDVAHAESLFSNAKEKDLPSYGAMMKGYAGNNLPKQAIELFNKIPDPNDVHMIMLLNACAQLKTKQALDIVKNISKRIPKSFFSNPHILTSLLDALMKCGDVAHAESLFSSAKEKVLSSYGAMMKGYLDNNLSQKAIDLFYKIENPDDIHMIILLNACAQLKTKEALDLVKKISNRIPKSFFLNPRLLTSLLDALMKCGDVAHAESLFSSSAGKVLPMYGAMMKGYVDNNLSQKAIDLFNEIENSDDVNISILFNACAQLKTKEALDLVKKISKQSPKSYFSNPHVLTSLLDALMKCGDVAHAELLFSSSVEKVLSSYGAMMKVYVENNLPEKAIELFNEIKNPEDVNKILFNQMKLDGIQSSIPIYLCAIKAVSHMGDYSTAQSIVKQIPDSLLVENQIQSSLIDLWGKVGYVDEAKLIFDRIRQPNIIECTAMINSYGLNGMGMQAIELFHQIPRECLHEATYVCALNACSHSGLVGQARLIFQNIEMKTMRIYSTMIDCLSRASFFEEAQELIDEYERNHSPEPTIKNPLISAAVLLANTYASSGEIDKASDLKLEMHKSGIKKKVGLTWITTDGQLYTFKAHDRSHPRSNEIDTEGEKISNEIIKYGHIYDSSWITRGMNADETIESVLCGHSERLAIAWGFVANPNASKLQMVKNLRICGDCHRSTKLIAAIRQCEIIVRDANRIHHFYKNGHCSCNDYF
ncbi:unnamed protein product [Rotaria magnacalcarata]|uniref:DYW domain-containing protein n=1 Tax=Rotaria magnacalcarata TaxID=392030 RepID=A0A816WNH1_9BILA|nr:unnamed protein product [Rotaria magnacalcarata]